MELKRCTVIDMCWINDLTCVINRVIIINMSLNTHKSVCMVFPPSDWSKVIMSSFPEFCANGKSLLYDSSFKYLGHIISSNNNDDADIQREVSNMFIPTNILSCKFHKCSVAVSVVTDSKSADSSRVRSHPNPRIFCGCK